MVVLEFKEKLSDLPLSPEDSEAASAVAKEFADLLADFLASAPAITGRGIEDVLAAAVVEELLLQQILPKYDALVARALEISPDSVRGAAVETIGVRTPSEALNPEDLGHLRSVLSGIRRRLVRLERGLRRDQVDEQIASISPLTWATLPRGENASRGKLAAFVGSLTQDGDLVNYAGDGDIDKVMACLDAGANPNATDRLGWSALSQAAINGGVSVAQVLLQHGANVNGTAPDETPLQVAADVGTIQVLLLLLEFGAAIDKSNEHGQTALISAAENGRLVTSQLLLAFGADPNARDNAGNSVVDALPKNADLELIQAIQRAKAGETPRASHILREIEAGVEDTQQSRCFIATAVYENENHPDIQTLRNFRDDVLMQQKWGRLFVTYYYKLSPAAAAFIARAGLPRALARALVVKPFIWIANASNRSSSDV